MPLDTSLHDREGKIKPRTTGAGPIRVGMTVMACDREPPNFGKVVEDNGSTVSVHFVSPTGHETTKEIDKADLKNGDGTPLGSGRSAPVASPGRRPAVGRAEKPGFLDDLAS